MTAGGRFLTRGITKVKAEAALSILAYNILRAVNLIGPFELRARTRLTKKEAPTYWSLPFPHGLRSPAFALAGEAMPDRRFPPPWTVEDYFLPLRTSRCSSKRRRFASNRRSVLSASHVSTPAALKRIMRPFCCCTMRRASATSSSARRRSSSESIYQNNAQALKQAQDSSRSPPNANSGPGGG